MPHGLTNLPEIASEREKENILEDLAPHKGLSSFSSFRLTVVNLIFILKICHPWENNKWISQDKSTKHIVAPSGHMLTVVTKPLHSAAQVARI